ncbi:MAG: pnp [Chlamydiales bacterium]|jgi:polyribonucleotide nucleotidyltransferase|nr:pnp [Chlamydiales bacterium]
MKAYSKTIAIGDRELTIETGKIARQANGSVVLRCGDTVILATACGSPEPSTDIDFLPLRVDYQEKFSSAGKTVNSFFKREGRPSEKETLVSRLIDRPLRPLFPHGYFHEVQLLTYVLSFDPEVTPDVLALCAASAALSISDIPLSKSIGAVRVGLIDGKLTVNPSPEQLKATRLDLVIAGTTDAILMIEGYADFLSEEEILEALEFGHSYVKKIAASIEEMRQEIGREKNMGTLHSVPEEVIRKVREEVGPMLPVALKVHNKKEREKALSHIKKQVFEKLFPAGETPAYTKIDVKIALKDIESETLRHIIFTEGIRSDGRDTTTVRPIDIELSVLPRTHGSALFTRGETQALAVCTLGGETMAQRYEDLVGEGSHRFYLQYFFPPFSVGEVGRIGSPGRREVGHGKLAERALAASLPSKQSFPYTIRLESNITECNGSSSMASVCGGCLALMEAGVPIKRPVAGIAMGLLLEKDRSVILSDILGIEDALGDMDFKITGDKEGITAFQMDIKVEGITQDIMRRALEQAKSGRLHILDKMLTACPATKEMSSHAPRIESLQIKPSKIAVVIGPGGKQIRAIIEQTGVQIDINDDGIVNISSNNLEGIQKAKAIIEGLTAEAEIGKTYEGKVVSVVEFGAFVEIFPGKQGLCHISEIAANRVADINQVVKAGDMLKVVVLDVNDRGQIKLSHKKTLAAPAA